MRAISHIRGRLQAPSYYGSLPHIWRHILSLTRILSIIQSVLLYINGMMSVPCTCVKPSNSIVLRFILRLCIIVRIKSFFFRFSRICSRMYSVLMRDTCTSQISKYLRGNERELPAFSCLEREPYVSTWTSWIISHAAVISFLRMIISYDCNCAGIPKDQAYLDS